MWLHYSIPALSLAPAPGPALNLVSSHYLGPANSQPRRGPSLGPKPQCLAQIQVQELTFLILREDTLEAL